MSQVLKHSDKPDRGSPTISLNLNINDQPNHQQQISWTFSLHNLDPMQLPSSADGTQTLMSHQ